MWRQILFKLIGDIIFQLDDVLYIRLVKKELTALILNTFDDPPN